MKFRLALLLAIMVSLAAPAGAQPAYMVKDLSLQAARRDSLPARTVRFGALDGVACFAAGIDPDQYGMWRSDGTDAGTFRVPGPGPQSQFVHVGPWLLFAGDDLHGIEIWRTDCTGSGSVLVKDINPGPGSSLFPTWADDFQASDLLVAVNGEAFFLAQHENSSASRHLWKTDGTEAGTQPVAIVPGSARELTYAAGRFFFFAEDPTHGKELWTSDGTDAGTLMVKDIRPGDQSSFPSPPSYPVASVKYLYPAGDVLLFAADDGVHGMELWRSDGTEEGTTLVADIVPGPGGGVDVVNEHWVVADGVLYFDAHGGGMGKEPWRSDGTEPGTGVLGDLAAGPSGSSPYLFTILGDRVVFGATGTSGPGIWITDGTAPGTTLLQSMDGPSGLHAAGDSLFFTGNGASGGLYRMGQTPGSAVLIKPLESFITDVVAIPGGFLFDGEDAVTGRELWRTDGTLAGTRLLRNINPDRASSFDFTYTQVRNWNDALLLSTPTGHGYELVRSDGSAAGTTRLAIEGFRGPTTVFNGRLIFDKSTPGDGDNVWSTDGTEAGTVKILSALRLQGDFAILNGRLLFTAGGWLWSTDGTYTGTELVTSPGHGADIFNNVTTMNQTLYFFAHVDASTALWRSDGTTAGTTEVAPIGPTSNDTQLTNVNGTLFFAGPGGLWKSDGTTAGTGLLEGFSGIVMSLTNMDGTLMFAADDGIHGLELWRSDGSEAGTVLVRDINQGMPPGLQRYSDTSLVASGHQVLFLADDGTHGVEPWRSDGTASGTFLLKDIAPGFASSDSQALTAIDDAVLFSADDLVHGRELWRSDGREAGTALLQDIVPGPGSSSPEHFIAAGPHIFFTAYTPEHGRELWAIERASRFYPCTVTVLNATMSIGAGGGGLRIGIRANRDCGWTVTAASPWISVTAGDAGSGEGGALLSIARNTTGSPRTATLSVSGQIVTVTEGAHNRAAASDFDGDSRADVSIWRPATGDWWSLRSSTDGGSYLRTHWGAAGDVPVPGDYDGDGAWDLAVFRPSNGTWYVSGGATVSWGLPGDIPVPGDYDGDGTTDIAVFRPGTGQFLIRGVAVIAWGVAGDIPVPADYNGDGMTDVAVFRPSTGTWYIRDLKTVVWGVAGDIPVAADYDGDGAADIAVFRPSSGVWDVLDQYRVTWGAAGDIPVPADRNGDGFAELGIFRRTTGTWYFQDQISGGIETVVWGAPGDVPLGRPVTPAMTIAGDFDGDRKADLTVFTPSTGEWASLRSMNGMTDWTVRTFGAPGDITVARDYDGDGQSDFAVYRPSTGWWYVLRSSTNSMTYSAQSWGLAGDLPVPGDYDGDGKADFAVFRPSSGRWVIRLSSADDNSYAAYDFGLDGDVPVPADYDGDGRIDIAVFRPSTGQWFILDRAAGTYQQTDWGLTGDVPAPADFDGDGKADLTVFRPSLGRWFIKSSIDGTYQVVEWGLDGDVMVPADFDGDGKADVAVFRPSNATWYVRDQFARVWHAMGDTSGIRIP